MVEIGMKQNIIEKIWDAHVVTQQLGHPAIFSIDFMLLHEVTSAQAFDVLKEKKLKVLDPKRFLATIDHSIPTRKNRHVFTDKAAANQVERLRNNVKEHGIQFYDFDSNYQGIVHVIGPEMGATQPGMTIVCGDSHTSTHGAFGALAFGIGTTEVGHVLATNCLLQDKPKTMKVEFKGNFNKGVYAKDAIMKLIAEIGVNGATGYIIEYTGDVIRSMSMDARMTLCNMTIECGARAGLIAPDEITYAYLKGKKFSPQGKAWDAALNFWQTLPSDAGCTYDKETLIDLNSLNPMVTWGTDPSQAVQINETIPAMQSLSLQKRARAEQALEYTKLHEGTAMQDIPIDWCFIGSCTNSRIEDLRIAANILRGKKIDKAITLYVVPGSEAVLKQAQAEQLDKIFIEAGANFRMPGCSLCIAMNDDKVPAGKRCLSTSNRNFVGRQGPGSITHLASPATVAASAIEGKITSPVRYEKN
jgi:3-isopropylmalate/(R)-2-methylmalate dehydratase large subunit